MLLKVNTVSKYSVYKVSCPTNTRVYLFLCNNLLFCQSKMSEVCGQKGEWGFKKVRRDRAGWWHEVSYCILEFIPPRGHGQAAVWGTIGIPRFDSVPGTDDIKWDKWSNYTWQCEKWRDFRRSNWDKVEKYHWYWEEQ